MKLEIPRSEKYSLPGSPRPHDTINVVCKEPITILGFGELQQGETAEFVAQPIFNKGGDECIGTQWVRINEDRGIR